IGATQSEVSKSYGWLRRKLFHEHLINLSGNNYQIAIDPVVNFQGGALNNPNPSGIGYMNTRGFIIGGRLGKKVTFTSSYLENQAVFPQYISDFVEYSQVVPGQGHARDFGDK